MSIPIDELKNRLKFAMAKMNIKPIELSEITKIPKSSISQYMSGYSKPTSERVYLISKALNVSEAWLMGFDVPPERNDGFQKRFPSPNITEDYTTFPVIGDIAAGYDKVAIEEWTGEKVDIPNSYLKGHNMDEFFVLCVKGDSMYPLYQENDKVLILKQSSLDYSGQIGAIIYEDCATIKKIEYKDGEDWLRLIAINPAHPPKRIENEELELCKVLGVPKLLIRDIKD